MIYFDNASTTIPFEGMEEIISRSMQYFGNPSSRHSAGFIAKKMINSARESIAESISAKPKEIIFTSGGTEANNILIAGLCKLKKSGHIITSSIEHESVLQTLRLQEENGFEVTYLPVDKKGHVRIRDFLKAIRDDTIFVTIQMVNNELGSLQNIEAIGRICKKKKIFFHSDCVQAVGHRDINVEKLHLDALSASSHKFGGLKGSGFLYCKLPLGITIGGGGQERGLRSGTENVLGILVMAEALKRSLNDIDKKQVHISELISFLETELSSLRGIKINVANRDFHSIINFRIRSIDNESLLAILDAKGICCSSGSACLSNGQNLSYVLKEIGLTNSQIQHSIRVSLSDRNTLEECARFVETIKQILNKGK